MERGGGGFEDGGDDAVELWATAGDDFVVHFSYVDADLQERAAHRGGMRRARDAALFAGSDGHAESAGHLLSLIVSARLHDLNPEVYLRDLIRVVPH